MSEGFLDGMRRRFENWRNPKKLTREIVVEKPRSIEEVIEGLDPRVPEEFLEQARKAAEFIEKLDRGEGGDEAMRKFVEQLGESGFVQQVVSDYDFNVIANRGPKLLHPREVLPARGD